VAKLYGANVLAVVLTGMGADGTRGSAAIREAGGEVIVQDEASSVVWGMPGSVVAARLAIASIPWAAWGRKLCAGFLCGGLLQALPGRKRTTHKSFAKRKLITEFD
jgi:hypothetical protein